MYRDIDHNHEESSSSLLFNETMNEKSFQKKTEKVKEVKKDLNKLQGVPDDRDCYNKYKHVE